MCIIYSQCVPEVLVIQHAMSIRCIILSSVAYLAVSCFSILPHKWHDFQKKVTEYKMCILTLSTTFFLKHYSH